MKFKSKIENKSWNVDKDGFLRCKTSVLKSGILDYHRSELGGQVPESVKDEVIKLFVPKEELENQQSLKSLEGKPIVVGHEWQESGNTSSVGNIAGAPQIVGNMLLSDILITDASAKERIMLNNGNEMKLSDQSSAYDCNIVWESGFDDKGNFYHGKQTDLDYNHVALLPIGGGRAGTDVRILNKQKIGASKVEFTQVEMGDTFIRVANDDLSKFKAELSNTKTKLENSASALEAQEALTKANDTIKELETKKAELEGRANQLQEDLEKASSFERIKEEAQKLTADLDQASKVMNAHGLELSDELKNVHGLELKAKVVNSIRVQNGSSELTEDQSKNEGFVEGVFMTLSEVKPSKEKSVAPAMGKTLKVENGKVSSLYMSNQERIKAQWSDK